MNGVQALSFGDLALAALFLIAPAALSFHRRLGVGRDLLVGGLRCFLQLTAVGYLLGFIFAADRWWWVMLMLAVMITVGGWTASQRQGGRIPGLFRLSTFSIFVTSLVTLGFITVAIVNVRPWYDPQYLIPLAGMVLGNAMNGSALAAERLGSELHHRRALIEVYLSLGATPAQATLDARRATLKASLIPTINSLMSVGIVHLPGIMSGQMLAGTAPVQAVRYQIVIMYMLVFVTTATAMLMTTLLYRRYFTARMQLRGELLLDG